MKPSLAFRRELPSVDFLVKNGVGKYDREKTTVEKA